MGFSRNRLRRLEGRGRGSCPECGLTPDGGPGRIVLIDDGTPAKGFPDDPAERCERCGRYLWCVIRLVCEEEGEGARADA